MTICTVKSLLLRASAELATPRVTQRILTGLIPPCIAANCNYGLYPLEIVHLLQLDL